MMEPALDVSTNSSLQAHTGYSWKENPLETGRPPVFFNPDPGNRREWGGNVPQKSLGAYPSQHGTYDNSWYCRSPPPPYSSSSQSDAVSYLSLHPDPNYDILRDQTDTTKLPQRDHSVCEEKSNPSRDSEKERPGSDPLLTGNESGGKSVRVIVAFALVAVVALVVGVVVFVIMRNGPTDPPPTTTTTESPKKLLQNCTRQSARYVPSPDTYPDNCHKFQRCVGDTLVEDSCGSGLEFSYDENGDKDVVCAFPSNVTYCGKRFLQENVTMLPMANRTGHIGGNVSLECVMTHITRLAIVRFLHNDMKVASLNVTDMNTTSYRNNVDVSGQRGEGRERRLVAVLTVSNLSCSDEGSVYECVAEDGEHVTRETATLQLTRNPEAPTLEIPTDLVEFRTTQNPKCVTSSLGYNPSMDFSWTLKRPDGQEKKIERSRHNDSQASGTCDTAGTSVLDAQNYVTWNGSYLCCQVVNTMNNNSVVKETCNELLVLSPVEMDAEPVADIDMAYSLRCSARNVSGDAQVEIHHKNQLLASFNTSSLSGATQKSGLSVDGRMDNDMLTVTLNFTKITCSDGGSYTCIVKDSGVDTNATTMLAVRSLPNEPILKVPDAAEGVTGVNPTCEVTSFGYNPVMTLTWVLVRPNGGNETLATYGADDSGVTKDDSTCKSSIDETTLDAGLYTGWNNSQLCCQVTHPDTSVVVKEKCQLMLLVPKDYCPLSGNTNMVHPYDPCDKWVQCVNGIEYVNNCGGTGLCFNIAKNACTG